MGKMTIATRAEMIDQLRRYTAQGMAPGVAVATWMESFPAEMQRNSSVNPGDANWGTDGHLPVYLSVDAMKEVIREAFGGNAAKADRVFTEAMAVGRSRQVGRWISQGMSTGEVAVNCAKVGWSLDEVVAAIDQAYSDDHSATTRSALARDLKTPPAYLEALAERALAGDFGLELALRSNPAAQALVAQSTPVEQLAIDGPDI
jgi:hypothetical protein